MDYIQTILIQTRQFLDEYYNYVLWELEFSGGTAFDIAAYVALLRVHCFRLIPTIIGEMAVHRQNLIPPPRPISQQFQQPMPQQFQQPTPPQSIQTSQVPPVVWTGSQPQHQRTCYLPCCNDESIPDAAYDPSDDMVECDEYEYFTPDRTSTPGLENYRKRSGGSWSLVEAPAKKRRIE